MKYHWKKLSKTKPKKTGLYYVEFVRACDRYVVVARYVAKKQQFRTAFYDEPYPEKILRWAKK